MPEHEDRMRVRAVQVGDPTKLPMLYVNHVLITSTQEEVYMTLHVRYDQEGKADEGEFVVPAVPVAVVVTNPAHALRWAKSIISQLERTDEHETD